MRDMLKALIKVINWEKYEVLEDKGYKDYELNIGRNR